MVDIADDGILQVKGRKLKPIEAPLDAFEFGTADSIPLAVVYGL